MHILRDKKWPLFSEVTKLNGQEPVPECNVPTHRGNHMCQEDKHTKNHKRETERPSRPINILSEKERE